MEESVDCYVDIDVGSVLEKGWKPKVLAINVSKFTTSLYIAVEEHLGSDREVYFDVDICVDVEVLFLRRRKTKNKREENIRKRKYLFYRTRVRTLVMLVTNFLTH